MYVGFFNYYEWYNQNRMFSDPAFFENDDVTYAIYLLGQNLQNRGHRVNTIDLEPNVLSYDRIVFFDFPTFNNPYFSKLVANNYEPLYLILFEHEFMRPDNRVENHHYFKKIGTWNDDLVDNIKYFKINYAHRLNTSDQFGLELKEKLCTLINSNRTSGAPLELYSERVKAIRWFEQNHPEDFDLYGGEWDPGQFPSYRGRIASKREVLQKYHFCICYENVRELPGYITEKIFDCFIAGCVPVYLGAPNIANHIPAGAYIDRRHFGSYEELYAYLKGMTAGEYSSYLNVIKDYLESNKSDPFSPECFIKGIATRMLEL